MCLGDECRSALDHIVEYSNIIKLVNMTTSTSWVVLIFGSMLAVRAAFAQKSGNGGIPSRFKNANASSSLVLYDTEV